MQARLKSRSLGAACLLSLMPVTALAHALPTRHELPVQLEQYLLAAGAVVALTFLLLALGARPNGRSLGYPRFGLGRSSTARAVAMALRWVLRAIGVAAFLIVIAAGLLGNQHPIKNIAPVLVWVLWWVGLAFVCCLFGNVWPHLNPWRTLFETADWLAGGHLARAPRRPYPARLGSWPAVIVLLIFAWMELVWSGAERPRALAIAILLYSAVTWAGMALYEREVWLERAEGFSIFFGILGRFAPISAGAGDPDPAGTLRPFAVGLTASGPESASRVAFIILMLAVVTFDGLRETPLWEALSHALLSAPTLAPVWERLLQAGFDPPASLVTTGLIVMPLLFFGAYALTCRISGWAAELRGHGANRPLTHEIMGLFALSLVPIAIAYHFAHYLAYLLLAGQLAIPLLSDPLGLGWNLFGTTLYRFDIGIIDARTVWRVCLVAIVLGHVAAVYLAHRSAVMLSAQQRQLAIQVPIAALMVGYTMSSLWILAQPIVESPPSRSASLSPLAETMDRPSCLPKRLGPLLLHVGPAEAPIAQQRVIEPAHHLTLTGTLAPHQDRIDHRGSDGVQARLDIAGGAAPPDFEPVELPARQMLQLRGEPVEFVYFPQSAVVSFVVVLEDGGTVEVGMVGKEGLVGAGIVFGEAIAAPYGHAVNANGRSV